MENERTGRDQNVPPGWSYDPSSWPQRLPIVGLALVGTTIAVYLTLYQVRVLPGVWEPFFGDGSRVILNSKVSRLLPVPDAALGAFGYLVDAVTGVIGGRGRWRTMPWIVILFGLAVGPLGLSGRRHAQQHGCRCPPRRRIPGPGRAPPEVRRRLARGMESSESPPEAMTFAWSC